MTAPLETVPQLIARARQALQAGGNPQMAVDAINEALKQAPRDIGLILYLGDAHHAAGQKSDAGHAYGIGLKLAAQINPVSIPDGIRQALQRAEARRAEYSAAYESFLRARLPGSEKETRFDQALEILLGRRQIYVQQPTKFYFPGLPQIQFYDTALFDWASELEAKADQIREELISVMTETGTFSPYLSEEDTARPHVRSHTLQGSLDWAAYYIWKDGARVEDNARRCPVTAAAFENVPLDFLTGQAPSVLFSRLKPGAHIPPHHGLVNTRLIGHLPLLVPGPAWLRVGNQVHHWQEGQLVIFDDSIEHEAKNEADETRVVLLFDFWKPEITLKEREQIAALTAAISDYSGDAIARAD
ncbi:beta-hydroxylase, aspartyl/asparaginyl family [Hyphomonas neptunium ATCC 15444]|uniref:Beta-hydroxylase, aspartyl/asparaginyl family n=2 Tax=Hyphomonas TaxID=85 RepID=Q0C182_HYPNA|nr:MULTISPECIES: aspartyl/asparaginyl beta-hydroxylase domain-containing protein [Hyphomonas]ABI75492.1 beta-hydroxylase, aspartyl/asparaginyl family [Hyphomonas neptunium ATCC 15444]KCZ95076.1 beta-hydroxylase [Hyphomonas hirschiana VP5]